MPPPPVIIVGAGPAGLATAACLRSEGISYEIIEAASTAGAAWRGHYRRLRLHTVKAHSALPFHPFPKSVPTYPSRQEVVDYLESYAQVLDITPRFNTSLKQAKAKEGGWILDTSEGVLEAQALVMATGYNRIPKRPTWPGEEGFTGTILHSRAYREGRVFAGKRVLVVGMGNTGGEIAIDLWEQGARPSISIRSPMHVVPRDALGLPAQVSSLLMRPLPLKVQDAIIQTTSRALYGDLSQIGISTPTLGPATQIETLGKVPLIDIGTVDLLRQGHIQLHPEVQALKGDDVLFKDGTREAFDVVVLATGYTPQLEMLIEGIGPALNERGYPINRGQDATLPGLYCVGFSNPITGFLRHIAIDAKGAAAAIAQQLSNTSGERHGAH